MTPAWWRKLEWQRGLRAAIAVGSAMAVCHLLGRPPGAAALGAVAALLVDNGGPYRIRLVTMSTLLLGGAASLVAGALVPANVVAAIVATAAVCFVVIFLRALSQPISSSGVLILVLYFAGLGGTVHDLTGALVLAAMVLLGGAWAVLLSLLLWPLDPFRPARLAIAQCYAELAAFSGSFAARTPASTFEWQRRQRRQMELASDALGATTARAPARTIRARNLTVLLETCDLLLARTMRLTELADIAADSNAPGARGAMHLLLEFCQPLGGAERAVVEALEEPPVDSARAFRVDGSLRLEFIDRPRAELELVEEVGGPLAVIVLNESRAALLELEVAFDAIAAIWTGTEVRGVPWRKAAAGAVSAWDWGWIDSAWRDALAANWTLRSAILRHALRVAMVGAVDVIAMRLIHVNHGFWLPMTSIILLQPYAAGTTRKSVQRVTGTVAGGILAAMLANAITSQLAMIVVITTGAALTLATFAVDYAVYCFFLTPTFVLMSLPHLHDWRYAGIRIGTTLIGALIAITAMRLLWPEQASQELGRLLRQGAAADAAYLRALLEFWQSGDRTSAERELLAVARRACGLASNDAEEALDRVMQEPQFGRLSAQELTLRRETLAFTTYLRRLTQSITAFAVIGRSTPHTEQRLAAAAARMERIATADAAPAPSAGSYSAASPSIVEEQLERMERQVAILEKTALMVVSKL